GVEDHLAAHGGGVVLGAGDVQRAAGVDDADVVAGGRAVGLYLPGVAGRDIGPGAGGAAGGDGLAEVELLGPHRSAGPGGVGDGRRREGGRGGDVLHGGVDAGAGDRGAGL